MHILKKNAQGYGYTYTDLAEITKLIYDNGLSYFQYIEPLDGVDYIMTVIEKDGTQTQPIRGCRVVEAKLSGKSNPVQEYGAALTYCRRYSLLMAFGLATTDDDAQCLTRTEVQNKTDDLITQKEQEILKTMCENKGYDVESVFPKGLALTSDQYCEALKRLEKLPERRREHV
ncbi:MAG: ERF family protein [Clostridiales bacterium]|nr:ERF family protein [Clostridiales bacterium]